MPLHWYLWENNKITASKTDYSFHYGVDRTRINKKCLLERKAIKST